MKERIMTFVTTTFAALSIAAVAAVALSIEPTVVAPSADIASAAAKSEQIIVAGRRRGKCTEDLGYGRTGSFGCGG
jgi:signal transduction protein with GAF and PtsI domain